MRTSFFALLTVSLVSLIPVDSFAEEASPGAELFTREWNVTTPVLDPQAVELENKRQAALRRRGVTASAAIMRSPSFSLSSSSMRMTILPARMSSRMSGTLDSAMFVACSDQFDRNGRGFATTNA